jgi:adenylate kinase family enzyme
MKISRRQLRQIIREALLREASGDAGRHKAIFMAGCPGSGKGTVIKKIFGVSYGVTSQGMEIVNQDQLYEAMLKDWGYPLSAPDLPKDDPELKAYQVAAGRMQYSAGIATMGGPGGISPSHVGLPPDAYGYKMDRRRKAFEDKTTLETHIIEGKGVIIDGTAANYKKIEREKRILEELGYRTMMLAVRVPLQTAIDRNHERADKGDRSIHIAAVIGQCKRLEPNFEKYRSLFGSSYIEVDNTVPVDQSVTPDIENRINSFILSRSSF